MLEAKTKVTERIVHSKGHRYSQIILYVPRDVAKDSAFPFRPGDAVTIRIRGETLVVAKVG